MIVVMGSFRLPAAHYEAALPLMNKVIAATRAEHGCVLYAYARDIGNPEVIRVNEKWHDRAAFEAHVRSAHMATWASERTAFGLSERDIRVFETDEGVAI